VYHPVDERQLAHINKLIIERLVLWLIAVVLFLRCLHCRWILVGRRMNRGENVRKIDANSYIFILGLQNDGQGSNTYQHESGPGYYIEINF